MVSLNALGWSSLYLNSRLMNAVRISDAGGECLIVSICHLKSSELNNRSWQKTCYCKSIQLVTASVIARNNFFFIAFELFREHRTLRLMGNARTVLSKDKKRTCTDTVPRKQKGFRNSEMNNRNTNMNSGRQTK